MKTWNLSENGILTLEENNAAMIVSIVLSNEQKAKIHKEVDLALRREIARQRETFNTVLKH